MRPARRRENKRLQLLGKVEDLGRRKQNDARDCEEGYGVHRCSFLEAGLVGLQLHYPAIFAKIAPARTVFDPAITLRTTTERLGAVFARRPLPRLIWLNGVDRVGVDADRLGTNTLSVNGGEAFVKP